MINTTKININDPKYKIKLKDNIFSIGSCFSNETAKYLNQNGIFIFSNPFGTIYNTYSIYKAFERIFNKYKYTKKDLFNKNGLFFSLEHSTKYDSNNIEKILNNINKNINTSYEYLKNANIFIITLGTSVVFEYKKTITANCHKLPNNLFNKKILNVSENTEFLKKIKEIIFKNNSKAKIIFTLSPVRHSPSDLVENSYSKSTLRTAIGKVIDNKSIFYFPSYEIVMDELRDYSYFKKDMLHLKKSSVQYIMEIFKSTFFDNDILEYINEYNSYRKIKNHKIKNPGTKEHFELLKKVFEKLDRLYSAKPSTIIEKELFKISKELLNHFPNNDQTKELLDKILKNIPVYKELFNTAYLIKTNKIKIDKSNFLKSTDKRKIAKYKIKLLKEYYLKNNDHINYFKLTHKS